MIFAFIFLLLKIIIKYSSYFTLNYILFFFLSYWKLHTCGKQSGRASKITRTTPMGTVICSSSRLGATLVRRSTRPVLFWADVAICRMPIDKLLILAADRLRRFNMAGGKRPKETISHVKTQLSWKHSFFEESDSRHLVVGFRLHSKGDVLWARNDKNIFNK